jgi:simple sugar transport system permease protein
VITTIMLNFCAVSLVLYLLSTTFFRQQAEPIAKPVRVAFPHLFGSSLRMHLGILVAIAIAIGVAWLVNRSTVGFEFRAVGANQLLSVTPSLLPGFASGLGFDGIAIALLGRATSSGVVLAAFLFGALRAGGRSMQAATQTPIEIIVVIQAAVIAFVAAPALVRALFRIRERRVVGSETFAKGWGG